MSVSVQQSKGRQTLHHFMKGMQSNDNTSSR